MDIIIFIYIYIRHSVILYAQNLDMQVFGFYIFTYLHITIYTCINTIIYGYNNIHIYIFDIPLFCMRKTWICKYPRFYIYINIRIMFR